MRMEQLQVPSEQFIVGKLSNGTRWVHLPSVGQVAFAGIMVGVGSRDETPRLQGLSHLIEHMLFKGTAHRSAFHLSNRIESVGGELNAYTAKEETVIHAAFMPIYLERVVELLADILHHATFPQRELTRERTVVLEEIASYKDSPAELIYDEFEEMLYQGNPIAHGILGLPRDVRRFSREDILQYIGEYYHPGNTVFCCAGAFSTERVVKLAEHYFGSQPPKEKPSHTRETTRILVPPHSLRKHRSTSQAHCLIGAPALPMFHEDLPTMALIASMLGGYASTARLNRSLREQQGLAYIVEASHTAYSDTGFFSIYFGTDKTNLHKAILLTHRELEHLASQPLGSMQLRMAKRQFIGQMCIGTENVESKMLAAARATLEDQPYSTLQESIAQVEAVTAEQIMELTQSLLLPEKLYTLIYC